MPPRKDPKIAGRVSWALEQQRQRPEGRYLGEGTQGRSRLSKVRHKVRAGTGPPPPTHTPQVMPTQSLSGGMSTAGTASQGVKAPAPTENMKRNQRDIKYQLRVTHGQPRSKTPAPPLPSWVTLGKRGHLSVPQFPQGS